MSTSLNSLPVVGANARSAAHNNALQVGTADVASELVRVLGRQIVGVMVNKSGRTVQRWIGGESHPGSIDERTLRNAYQVYLLLSSVEGDHTIRAWFMGMNPQLEDQSPAEALAKHESREVMAAARAFVNGG